MKKLIVFYGPSASGKTSVEKELLRLAKNKIKPLISLTTRQPREGEINGKDYIFCRDRQDFYNRNILASIQIGKDREWVYGINKDSFKDIKDFGIISVISINYIDSILSGVFTETDLIFDDIYLFFFTADLDVRKARMSKRKEDPAKIQARLAFEDKVFPEDFERNYADIINKKIFDTSDNPSVDKITQEILDMLGIKGEQYGTSGK